jgi:zinc transport system ATP-binding protein
MSHLVTVHALAVPRRLAPVTFVVPQGTLCALVGPNGSGKSTVLEALLGVVKYSGSIHVTAQRLAFVPQRLELPEATRLRVIDFLALQRTRWPVALGVWAVRARVERLLGELGLEELLERQLGELSLGQLRRVLLADALERQPQLLLLDEPEAGLDDTGRAWLDTVLESLPTRGVTTLLVSHDAERVARLASSTIRLGASHG